MTLRYRPERADEASRHFDAAVGRIRVGGARGRDAARSGDLPGIRSIAIGGELRTTKGEGIARTFYVIDQDAKMAVGLNMNEAQVPDHSEPPYTQLWLRLGCRKVTIAAHTDFWNPCVSPVNSTF